MCDMRIYCLALCREGVGQRPIWCGLPMCRVGGKGTSCSEVCSAS